MQFTKSYSYVFHWRKQVIYRFKMTWGWVNVDSRLLKLPWECDCSQLCAVDDLFTGYSESWFSLKMYGKLCPFCMDVQIKQPVKFPSTWISHHCLFNALWKQQLELSRLNCRSNHNVFEIHGNKLECGSNMPQDKVVGGRNLRAVPLPSSTRSADKSRHSVWRKNAFYCLNFVF